MIRIERRRDLAFLEVGNERGDVVKGGIERVAFYVFRYCERDWVS